jgi:L-iditol 2-dehydrogenase
MNIKLAKLISAKVIATDIDDYRLNKAKEFGADEVIDVSKEKVNVKAERIIVCTGAYQAVKQAFECIDRKGIILFFAVPEKNIEVPSVDLWRNELTIASSYGAASADLKESLDLIKNKKVNVKGMITHKLPLEKIQEGFKLVTDAKESLKVVLTN